MQADIREKATVALAGLAALEGATRAAAALHLRRQFAALFRDFPVENYVALLDSTGRRRSMYYIDPKLETLQQEIASHWGKAGLEIYHRVVMLELMQAFRQRAAQHRYPDSILAQFQVNYARIERNIISGPIGTYPHDGDNFIKDFSLCRQTAFPGGGAWIVEHYAGFGRSTLFKGGIGQFFRFLRLFLFATRGHRPLYSMHIHNELTRGHTLEERQACHLRIAEMLERHPEVKGMYGASWLTDPAIPRISPKLRWIRQIPEANGCEYFRLGTDIEGGALTRSATRRRLFEEGKYIPTRYLSVWPRTKMIAWAKRVRAGSPGHARIQSRIASSSSS